jgi:hypothetical protein
MATRRKTSGYEPASVTPERRTTYAVTSSAGDATGPLTLEQAQAERDRLQRESDAAELERVGENAPRKDLPPPLYEVTELGDHDRVAIATRSARPKQLRGLGDEEVGE